MQRDPQRDQPSEQGRELRDDLFKTQPGPSSPADPYRRAFAGTERSIDRSIVTVESHMPVEPRGQVQRVRQPLHDEVALDAEFQSIRLAVNQSDRRIEHLAHQLGEIVKVMQARLERIQTNSKASEDTNFRRMQELADMLAHLKLKVTENVGLELKVQEMLERHNTLVRNFENRLMAMQKVMAQQEMVLNNALATINEMRLQMSRGSQP